ncbi:MAG: hypothetical protein PHU65_03610 [Actinomycetota bacterium]|nr:hypothetical protein [Actinomycetota bacterium]
MLKKFIIISLVSLIVFVISIIMYEMTEAFLGKEDLIFFFIAVFLAPMAFFTGVIGSIVIYAKGRKKRY